MTNDLTPIPGATPRYDDDGREIVDIATCGTCGRSWNDAQSSSITPAPSGRCPFEYEHEDLLREDADEFTLTIELGSDAMRMPEDVAAMLRDIANELERREWWYDVAADGSIAADGSARDSNGNTVGRWKVS